ncbi:MAG: hypothetical protein MR576_07765 [Firmicutes bacterium]|nr:hypothetical protein [Bacillota bacterium]MDD7733838.1 hypothetical protein [Bacillota bacterium]
MKMKENKSVKYIFYILIAVLNISLFLSGCMKSESVKEAEKLINDIGTVTLDSKDAIESAEKAVKELSEEDKNDVSNIELLTDSRNEYDALLVDSYIDEIGNVDLNSGASIEKARKSYEGCNEEAKQNVKNVKKLESAEDKYNFLKAEQVDTLIAEIGTVTTASKEKINNARSAYDALDKDASAKVSKLQVLTSAESEYKNISKNNLLSKMRSETDKVQNCTFYYPKAYPDYVDRRSHVLPYIGYNSTSTWMCMESSYKGSEWIFWESLIFVIDGNTQTKTFNYYDINRETSNVGGVYECYNGVIDSLDIELFRKIADSNETIIRFNGDNHNYDLTVSASDKQAIKDVLDLYDILK